MTGQKDLIKAARAAAAHAYAPYSGFTVGAAIQAVNGRVYTGSNVENTSYGLSICAERVALTRAVSEGEREFTDIAIVGAAGSDIVPCGACLQMLAEFAPNLNVITVAGDAVPLSHPLTELLPRPFGIKK